MNKEHQEDPRFERKNEDIAKLMRDIGTIINNQMPDGWGFTLMLFEFGENGSMFYISKSERSDMIKVMKEFIARQDIEQQKETDYWKKRSQ